MYWTAEREGSGEGLEVELAEHAELTLTGLYNVLEKLRRDEPLPAKDKLIHERGLVAVMRSLHDELDAVVLDAYGWNDKPDDAALLERLVALTPLPRKRKEQSAGCAPIFKIPNLPSAPPAPTSKTAPQQWPQTLPEQVAAVASKLAAAAMPLTLEDLAANFKGKGSRKKRLPQLLDTLVALGKARALEDGRWMG
ncbi:MAG: hypothetical protein HY847_16490 [Betaproteobacteria bacterium]|nr:hypothetical protein [Betaproteobacteria bacterium]